MTVGVGAASAAGSTNPPWEPDANAAPPYGNIVFYAANGSEVTSGTSLSSPFAFAVAVTAADVGARKATVNFYNPQPGVLPSNWTGTGEAGPTTFSPSSSLPPGTPADVVADAPAHPVVATSTASITNWLGSNTPSKTADYANTIQVRLTDSGPGGHGNAPGSYWETDIGYNTTSSPITVDGTAIPAKGWAQLFPLVRASTISLAASPPSPQISGTQVTLTATVTPSSAAGEVQFFDGKSALSSPVTVTSGTASTAFTPGIGTHSYSAEFVPSLGDETAANTATATVIGGSTSNTVPYTITSSTPTVTVTKFSPTPLGQGASGIGVTLTGTEFASGATVTVAGVIFSSVTVVDSTTITAKAKVAPSAKVGATTVTVSDSAGSGSCTTCLSIVAAPTVKSITPSSLTPGASKSVTIEGTGFLEGANRDRSRWSDLQQDHGDQLHQDHGHGKGCL